MAFLFNWVWGVLDWFNIFSAKNAKVLFLGLDNAGKTTMLHMLRDNHLSVHPPTFHPTSEELSLGNIKFKAYDLGGHEQARAVWPTYFATVDAIVFIVDSFDRERFLEARKELAGLLGSDDLANVPFLVLGNKIDIPKAAPEDELRLALGLQQTTGRNPKNSHPDIRPVELFMCSFVLKTGYKEGFQWLASYLK